MSSLGDTRTTIVVEAKVEKCSSNVPEPSVETGRDVHEDESTKEDHNDESQARGTESRAEDGRTYEPAVSGEVVGRGTTG